MDRSNEALQIITSVMGAKGVWASPDRYAEQCWTRDFALSTGPIIAEINPVLHYIHVMELVGRQHVNGAIPILFADDEDAFLARKLRQWRAKGADTPPPFMLRRWLDSPNQVGLYTLTPSTRDSEVLFVAAAARYAEICPPVARAVERAMECVSQLLVDGLIPGADWRDTRDDLDDKCVLTNACHLHRAYALSGLGVEAEGVASAIAARWNGSFFEDYPGCTTFDLLGNALTLLLHPNVATPAQAEATIAFALDKLRCKGGFALQDTFLPPRNDEEAAVMARDKAVNWPWVSAYFLLAMLEAGTAAQKATAREIFDEWSGLEGFAEFYSVGEGKPYGSADQAWSAALYLKVQSAI
jgi:hypothetical protein